MTPQTQQHTTITDENWIHAIWASQLSHTEKMLLIYLFGKVDFNKIFIHEIERASISEIILQTEIAKKLILKTIQKLRKENYIKLENFSLSINENEEFSYNVTAKIFNQYFENK